MIVLLQPCHYTAAVARSHKQINARGYWSLVKMYLCVYSVCVMYKKSYNRIDKTCFGTRKNPESLRETLVLAKQRACVYELNE